jgi:hypothetical protein
MKQFSLDNEPKIKLGFKTPDGYFDSFTERLMQQLPEPEVKVVPLYRKTKAWIAGVAAVLVMALGLTVYFNSATRVVQPDDAAIENYLVYQAGLNSYDLIQNLDESDIRELEQSVAVSDEAIEDYLYNENIINN